MKPQQIEKQMTQILDAENLAEQARTKRAIELAMQLGTDELWAAVQWFIAQPFDGISDFNSTRHVIQVAVIHVHALRYTGTFI